MVDILDTDWAYAAGMVDGEGCIAIVRSFVRARDKFSYGVQVVVANTDRGVLDWIQTAWGGNVVAVNKGRGRERNSWAWRCGPGVARTFLIGIRPWLRIKGRQCDNALAMLELLQRSRRTLGRAPCRNNGWTNRKSTTGYNADSTTAAPTHLSPRKCIRRAGFIGSDRHGRPQSSGFTPSGPLSRAYGPLKVHYQYHRVSQPEGPDGPGGLPSLADQAGLRAFSSWLRVMRPSAITRSSSKTTGTRQS